MKKIISISVSLLIFALLLLPISSVVAKQNGTQGNNPSVSTENRGVTPQGNQQGQVDDVDEVNEAITQNRGENITKALTRITERKNNPETGEQIREMIQNQEQLQVQSQEAVKNMSQRNKFLKLVIGPDYKNAGQLRSNIVNMENDITKLEELKEDATGDDAENIQLAINELQDRVDDLDTSLEEELSSFSLFGWLARRFGN